MTMTSSDVPPLPGSAVHRRRRRRRIASGCAAFAAGVLLIAGCGSATTHRSGSAGANGNPSATSVPGGASGAGTTSAAKISLTVSFSGSASTEPRHYTLRCEPAGGSVRDAAAACTMLMKHAASLFRPRPAHIECPMIMASAGRATVTGTYLGRHVHELIANGGCDLSRWAELGQIVRAAG
jgi:Subtilisin inhibitor-like